MQATLIAREEMVRNWERVAPPPVDRTGPPLRALNLEHVMDLGNTIFFTFRGRAFGIPPLAWREGEKIFDVWQEARGLTDLADSDQRRAYFRCIARLQKLVWANCKPVGPVRRWLRFFHLHRNPFRRATEGEIAELAVFILGRRTKSSGRASATQPAPEPGT